MKNVELKSLLDQLSNENLNLVVGKQELVAGGWWDDDNTGQGPESLWTISGYGPSISDLWDQPHT
jgi:hypothetical protein